MFYYLQYYSDAFWVLKYITVRSVAGAGTAFLAVLLLGPWFIRFLKRQSIGDYVRKEEAPPLYDLHSEKEGTPTMGGLLIIAAVTISCLLWTDVGSSKVWLVLGSMWFMGLTGMLDDYKKVLGKQSKGLSARGKLLLQIIWGIVLVVALLANQDTAGRVQELTVPFFKYPVPMGMVFAFVFTTLVIVGASNAVNLTDGLDGLAIGCSSSVAISYLIMSYVAGHVAFSEYLLVPYIRGAGELSVFCGCLTGACLGFLWYNCHPAKIFMGDTGSLALGGAMATVAIVIKQELALIIVGGVFVIEALSVILQVLSFKLRGKRIFAMAPIHHHFEMKKWSETQVVVRFWIISIIFALLGILTLKIR
jgi:phospho-N-acetylmuramoyl-pentapeptide-transferase